MKYIKIVLFIVLSSVSTATYAQKSVREQLVDQPYTKYELHHKKSNITFYLSTTQTNKKLPLVVYIQGSGMQSLFREKDGKILSTSGHSTWNEINNEQYRVLVVEKPGVSYLQSGTTEFDEKFSLENWSETLVNAIKYVLKHEAIDRNKILIAGHSEGGVVAARVAKTLGNKVSHVAIMAGEGPSQLYSLYKFAKDGTFFNTEEHNMPTAEQRLQYLTEQWNDILSDPENTEKKFWGLSYLRWSSLLKTSVIDELSQYDGKILLVQGTADDAVHPESALVAYTSLLSKGKNVQLQLIEGVDHSFYNRIAPKKDGWGMTIADIIRWFGSE